jgi:hypothetical protein
LMQVVDQTDRRWDIGRMGRSHALDCDRVPRSDRDRADADASCGISLNLHGDSFGRFGWLAIVYRRRADPPTAGCFAWEIIPILVEFGRISGWESIAIPPPPASQDAAFLGRDQGANGHRKRSLAQGT